MASGHYGYGYFTLKKVAERYQVSYAVVRDLSYKLNLAQERVGRTRIFTPPEIPVPEIGLRALGHPVSEEMAFTPPTKVPAGRS
jgi:hypothetical protein